MTEPEQDAVVPDVDPDDEDEDDLDNQPDILRAKWTMDGATTLAEAAEKIRAFAAHIGALITEGYELVEAPVRDDYAFIRKTTT